MTHCGEQLATMRTRYGVRVSCNVCGAYAWGVDNPLAPRSTHEARKRAHEALDSLWRDGEYTRAQAYRELARRMRLAPAQCHMKQMDETQCAEVVRHAADMKAGHDQ